MKFMPYEFYVNWELCQIKFISHKIYVKLILHQIDFMSYEIYFEWNLGFNHASWIHNCLIKRKRISLRLASEKKLFTWSAKGQCYLLIYNFFLEKRIFFLIIMKLDPIYSNGFREESFKDFTTSEDDFEILALFRSEKGWVGRIIELVGRGVPITGVGLSASFNCISISSLSVSSDFSFNRLRGEVYQIRVYFCLFEIQVFLLKLSFIDFLIIYIIS